MSNILKQQNNFYWLVKESNEYEYTDQYYLYGDFDQIQKELRNIIYCEFQTNIIDIVNIQSNKIKFKMTNMLDFPKNEDYTYNFEIFEVEAIKKPHIKNAKHLKHECYDMTNNFKLINGE